MAKVETKDVNTFIQKLYDTSIVNDALIHEFIENFSYGNFNRDYILRLLEEATKGDTKIATEIIVAVALRGPVGAIDLKLSNGKTIKAMGIKSNGSKGDNKTLTLGKIQAATADLAAFYLKKINPPKRIDSPLPSWLQFPSAGSIKLPVEYREMHKDFSRKFSVLIGGEFNEQIYFQMEQNAYINNRLNLF